MRHRVGTILVIAILCLAPLSWADVTPYNQDFEGLLDTTLDQPDQVALANDGWSVFVNGFGPDWSYWYRYGPFPAPNGGCGGPAFSAVVVGEGGSGQGDQQLSVYSDYNNLNHQDGSNAIIESNVYQQRMVDAADVGSTWRFEFDAKRGNIEGASMAAAFVKTFAPGWALIDFFQVSTTNLPNTWGTYSIEFTIDSSMVGGAVQFGFVNWASNGEGSGIFYDNVNFDLAPLSVGFDIRPEGCPNPITSSRGLLPVAVLGTADFDVSMIDVASLQLEGVAPMMSAYEDVAEPFTGDLCGCTEAGPDGFIDLALKFRTQDILGAIGLPQGFQVLTLTGALIDGTPIEGQDCIVFVGGGRPNVREMQRVTVSPRLPSSSEGSVDLQSRTD